MPLAPGRAFALRMPGGPTGGPYGDVSQTIWNDEYLSYGNRPDRHPHGRARPSRLSVWGHGRPEQDAVLQRQPAERHVVALWPEAARNRERPAVFHARILFDVQGLKGRVLDVGEEIKLADLKACLERQNLTRGRHHSRRRGVRSDRSWLALDYRGRHLLRRRSRDWARMRALVGGQTGLRRRRRQFRGRRRAARRPGSVSSLPSAPDHETRHLSARGHDVRRAGGARSLCLRLCVRPLPIVGATGSLGNPIAML